MIGTIAAILASLAPIIVPLLGMLVERSGGAAARRKEMRDEAKIDVDAGVADRDPSRLTAGFDRLGRM
jgi:hypothetical protein